MAATTKRRAWSIHASPVHTFLRPTLSTREEETSNMIARDGASHVGPTMVTKWPAALLMLLGVCMLPIAFAACPHEALGLLDWHDPATWPDGVVPAAGATVNLPVGKSVVLRSSSDGVLGKVTVPTTSNLILGRS